MTTATPAKTKTPLESLSEPAQQLYAALAQADTASMPSNCGPHYIITADNLPDDFDWRAAAAELVEGGHDVRVSNWREGWSKEHPKGDNKIQLIP